MQIRPHTQEYDDGKTAYWFGEHTNPYATEEIQHHDWEAGHTEARNDHQTAIDCKVAPHE